MNILFLNSYPEWGGGETWMLDVAEGLKERGHTCIIAGHENRAWYKRTKELGWNPLKVNIRGDIAPFMIAKLAWIERKFKIDLVLCNFDKEARLASLARGLKKRPAIVNMKGLSLMRGDNIFCRWSYRHLIDHTVVCANLIYNDFSGESWLDMKKFNAIHNCLNVNKLAPADTSGQSFRREWGIRPETRVIGVVARLVSRKGIQDLLAAAPKILEKHPDVKFVLVGEGTDKQNLVDLTRKLGVEKSVIFTGFRRDLHNFFPAFDIFVLPSYYEGLPYVIEEAMYYSKPIIATALDGVREAIEDGVSGLIVPLKNPDILAEKVNLLLEDDILRSKLAVNASETFHQRFSYSDMIDSFEKLFIELVEKSRSS
jgi:glycosyltransferase involved in cell wall biosynthesis